ncbi:MAG: hypothetical protein CMF46_02725 [Legionellales bacterium]|nr:hypothetical protein [Legionellales bacterium]|tara:strand:+ start:2947 stop:3273 length:327 start_codon:yes stop_codon:yes gene_type:complete
MSGLICDIKAEVSQFITARDLKQASTNDYIVIDVEPNGRNSIAGAWTVTRNRLIQVVKSFIFDRSTPVVICCADGGISQPAVTVLTRMGYSNVCYLQGGARGYDSLDV